MRNTVAITVEGVLRTQTGSTIQHGKDLYYGLASQAVVVLLTDDPIKEVEHWLAIEGMREHTRVYEADVIEQYMDVPEARLHMVNTARNAGHPISLVVDADPQVCSVLYHNGYTTLLFTHAQYALPQWRPGTVTKPTPWDELSAQIAVEAQRKADDKRLNRDGQ